MAKRNGNTRNPALKRPKFEMHPNRNQFTTSAGIVVTFNPGNPTVLTLIEQGVEDDFRERGEPIDVPTYTVKTAGGGEQTFEHDWKTVETHPEVKEEFEAHENAVDRMNQEIYRHKYEYAVECVTNPDPETDGWIKRQEKKKIRVPEDPDERRLHYVQTELLRTPEDSLTLFMEVTTSGLRGLVSDNDIEAIRKNFRGLMANPEWSGDVARTVGQSSRDARGELEALDSTDGGLNGEVVGNVPE